MSIAKIKKENQELIKSYYKILAESNEASSKIALLEQRISDLEPYKAIVLELLRQAKINDQANAQLLGVLTPAAIILHLLKKLGDKL